MKKISKIALVLLMLATGALGLAACDKKVSGLSVVGAESKIVTIEGNDLDLSTLTLVVDRGGAKTELALNAEGVTVEGYNKDVLGEQTITVTYEGVTTQFTVNVVKRVTIEGARKEYLEGESLKLNEGRVRVTKDDGTSFTANLSDSNVTVSGFKSTQTGKQTLTATCKKDGVTYEGAFEVTVYAIENATFKKPNSLDYQSHNDGMDLSGGLITLKGNNGKLTRYVNLTDAGVEISGFDPTVLTQANLDNPVTQEITVKYMNKTFTYDLELYYSKVSMIRDYAQELAVLDWTQTAPVVITQELGEKAVTAAKMFVGLSRANQKLIADADKESVVRAATVYGRDYTLAPIAQEYANVFLIKDGQPTFVESTGVGGYNAAKATIGALEDEDNAFLAECEFLVELRELCADMVLKSNITVGSYLAGVFDPDNVDALISRLEYMIGLYDQLSSIGAWTVDTLESHKNDIALAVSRMNVSTYTTLEDRTMYSAVSSWRENDDYFDILYTYYYNINKMDQLSKVKEIQLPGELEDLYRAMRAAYNDIGLVMQGKAVDTTQFMLDLQTAQELNNQMLELPDGLYKSLYSELTFAGMLTVEANLNTLVYYLTVLDYGYNRLAGSMLGKQAFNGFWEPYLDMVAKMLDGNGYLQTDEFAEDIEGVFSYFVGLAPTDQYSILLSMNPFYLSHSIPENALDYQSGAYTYFVTLLSTYYQSVLPEAAQTVFADLLIAMENYARRYSEDKHNALFEEKMQAVKTGYTGLSPEDRGVFNDYLLDVYEKYVEIFDEYANKENPKKTELGDWAAKFDELKETLIETNTIYYYIQNEYSLYAMYFASIEHAIALEAEILQAPEEIVKAYYHEEVEILNKNWTLEYCVNNFRTLYSNYLNTITLDMGGNRYYLWTFYEKSPIKAFLSDAAHVMWEGEMGDDATGFDGEVVKQSLKSFRELDAMSQALFNALDGERKSYRRGLRDYLQANLSEDAYNAAQYLLVAEEHYVSYRNNPEGTTFISINGIPTEYSYKELFISYMQTMGAYFLEGNEKRLSQEEQDAFMAIMGEHYEFYVLLHNELVGADQGGEGAEGEQTPEATDGQE